MKKSKFTEAQIAIVLKQAEDGTPVAEVCRKAGVAEATFYNWRKRYAGLLPSEVKRLRQLEEENSKLMQNKVPKRRVKAKLRDDRTIATMTNQIWAMDFVHNQLATGRKLRILTLWPVATAVLARVLVPDQPSLLS